MVRLGWCIFTLLTAVCVVMAAVPWPYSPRRSEQAQESARRIIQTTDLTTDLEAANNALVHLLIAAIENPDDSALGHAITDHILTNIPSLLTLPTAVRFASFSALMSPLDQKFKTAHENAILAMAQAVNASVPWAPNKLRDIMQVWSGNAFLGDSSSLAEQGIQRAEVQQRPLEALLFFVACFKLQPWVGDYGSNVVVAIACSIPGHCSPPPLMSLVQATQTSKHAIQLLQFGIKMGHWTDRIASEFHSGTTFANSRHIEAMKNFLMKQTTTSGGTPAMPPTRTLFPPVLSPFASWLPRCEADSGISWCAIPWLIAHRLYLQGRILANSNLLEGAVVYMEAAYKVDPSAFHALELGTYYMQLKLFQKASHFLEIAQENCANLEQSTNQQLEQQQDSVIIDASTGQSTPVPNDSAPAPTPIPDAVMCPAVVQVASNRLKQAQTKMKQQQTSQQQQQQQQLQQQLQQYDPELFSINGEPVLDHDARTDIVQRVALAVEGAKLDSPQAFALAIDEYVQMHSRMTSPGEAIESKKFVVVHIPPKLGVGNRLLSVVSAFVIGMLSKRALLVDWPLDLPPLSQLFELPRGLEWSYLRVMRSLSPNDLDKVNDLSAAFSIGEEVQKMRNISILACDDLSNIYSDSPFVHVTTNMWLAPIVAVNANHREHMQRMFYSSAHETLRIFRVVGKFLLRPSAAIEPSIATLSPQLGDHTHTLRVGLHIRAGTPVPEDKTRKELPIFSNEVERYAQDLSDCTFQIIRKSLQPHHTHVTVILAADNAKAKTRAINTLNSKAASKLPAGIQLHVLVHNQTIARNEWAGTQNAVVDWWLLSMCDVIVRPRWSTFSITSTVITDMPAYELVPSCSPSCLSVRVIEPRLGTLASHVRECGAAQCFWGGASALVDEMGDVFFPRECDA
eukprot:c4062_g1_i1.p1 GENE.c4062_g1_i1~~c4062_g1_i1.p1  ORF type:complete len:909 (+),score=209.70 c4062_g1_i1:3-2729(+)